MSEKLTKTVIKEELRRIIEWYEDRFKFDKEMVYSDFRSGSTMSNHFVRYMTYVDILWQIENGCFKGGFVA